MDSFILEKAPLHSGLFVGNPSQKLRDPTKIVDPDAYEVQRHNLSALSLVYVHVLENAHLACIPPLFFALRQEEEEEDLVEEEEDGERKVPERKLTELERLAFVVDSIENSTCVVPRGAFYITATGDISANRNFGGLSYKDAASLDNYLLFRAPQNERTLAKVPRRALRFDWRNRNSTLSSYK